MTLHLASESWDDLLALRLCRDMRPADRAEVFATRGDDNSFALYRDLGSIVDGLHHFEIIRDNTSMRAAALLGVGPNSPGVGNAFFWATDEFSLPMARILADHIREVVVPELKARGLHRVEALSLPGHRWAHRFLRRAGAHLEGARPGWGKQGETFLAFVWLDEAVAGAAAETFKTYEAQAVGE